MSERRTGWLLLVILAAQLALLASGVPAADGEHSALEAAGLRLVAPLARLTAATANSLGRSGENLRGRRTLLRDNRRLAAEVERLRMEVNRLRELDTEVEQLAVAVSYMRLLPGRARIVRVVYLDQNSWLRTLIVYTGDDEAVLNQPVLAVEGLVGRVIQVGRPYARAQLITDTSAAVGAMIERTRRQGIVRGVGSDRLEMAYVPLQDDVAVGDRVLTAGIDGIYPPGLLIGTVAEVEPGDDLFHHILLTPAVDFGRRLDHVYLLERQQLPAELTEAQPRALP